jgi:hypothetical protein
MQLTRSKKSALILSAVAVLSFTLTTALIDLLIPYLARRDTGAVLGNPAALSKPENLLAFFIFLAMLVGVLIAIGAFWLYRFFGERHYGPRGALRWALFGCFFALWIQALDWIFQGQLALLRYILQFLGIFATYFLTRALVPFENKKGDRAPT